MTAKSAYKLPKTENI